MQYLKKAWSGEDGTSCFPFVVLGDLGYMVMSSLWTPDGERPVNRTSGSAGGAAGGAAGEAGQTDSQGRNPTGFGSAPEPNGPQQDQIENLQRQLADTPADVVVANHCFGLFELAALHLSLSPPKLTDAQLAIDALGAMVEGLTGRLGEAEPHLTEGLSQLRIAFVQVRQRAEQAGS